MAGWLSYMSKALPKNGGACSRVQDSNTRLRVRLFCEGRRYMVRKFLFYGEIAVLSVLQLFAVGQMLWSWLPASAQILL